MNLVILTGNLGADPKLTEGDEPKRDRSNFNLAVQRSKGDEPDWFRITAWNGQARSCQQLTKGDRVLVRGRLASSTSEVDGETRHFVGVVAESVEFLRVKAWREDAAGDEG